MSYMTSVELRVCKQHMRTFMRAHYSDKHLAQALDHNRSGEMSFHSCCCFVGIATADHADGVLRGPMAMMHEDHLEKARYLDSGREAEKAFYQLGNVCMFDSGKEDILRRKRLIPMLKAEIRRRMRTQMGKFTQSSSVNQVTQQTLEEVGV